MYIIYVYISTLVCDTLHKRSRDCIDCSANMKYEY